MPERIGLREFLPALDGIAPAAGRAVEMPAVNDAGREGEIGLRREQTRIALVDKAFERVARDRHVVQSTKNILHAAQANEKRLDIFPPIERREKLGRVSEFLKFDAQTMSCGIGQTFQMARPSSCLA